MKPIQVHKRWYYTSLFNYELRKRIEKTQFWIAWKCPKWLVLFCVVRAASKAMFDNPTMEVTELDYPAMYKAMEH